jgi:plastocyanin
VKITSKLSLALILLLATSSLSGCKLYNLVKVGLFGSGEPDKPKEDTGPALPVDMSNYGYIQGVVTLKGKAPAAVPIDMSMDPACNLAPGKNLSEQIVSKQGGLGNVFIYVKEGTIPRKAPSDTPPVILDQKGCKFVPHVIGVQRGGYVEFRNSDSTMHNVHVVPGNSENDPVDLSMGPMGQPSKKQFNALETMMPVRCNNHPWMSAFINVAPNAYFGVSAPDGSFRLPPLPPGQYLVAFVHETLGEQEFQVNVPAQGAADASTSFDAPKPAGKK